MKTKNSLISAVVIILVTIGAIAYVVRQKDHGTVSDIPGSHRESSNWERAQTTDDRLRKARSRTPRIQSVEDAQQALLELDLAAVMGNDRDEAERCSNRLKALVAEIPEAHYSALAAAFGKGANNDFQGYIRQMAIYQEWGRKDLESAFADLSNVEDKRLFQKALHNVLVGAMDTDAAAAMKLAETIEIEPGGFRDSDRIDLMDTIYDNWVESDSQSALDWAKQAKVPDKRRNQWIADGLRAWSKKDPDAAERWRMKEKFEGFEP